MLHILNRLCGLARNRSACKSRICDQKLSETWLAFINVIWPSFHDIAFNAHRNLFHKRALCFCCYGHVHCRILGHSQPEELWKARGFNLMRLFNRLCYLHSLPDFSVYYASIGIELRSVDGCAWYRGLCNKIGRIALMSYIGLNLWYIKFKIPVILWSEKHSTY
jgi:hypothetical protein